MAFMRVVSASPKEMVTGLWRHRELIVASTRREILGRYRGSIMGILWSFFNPLFMLTVYTFVFGEIFKARWGSANQPKAEFALVLFAGLIIYNLFSECLLRAPNLVLSNPNYVKKVIYPLDILPWISFFSALFHAGISLAVWIGAYIILIGMPPLSIIYLPFVVFPFMFFIMGASWLLASLGVYLRDVSQVIGVVTTAMMFLSPIFYPASALPEKYRAWLYFNPLTPAIEEMRNVLYWGIAPDFGSMLFYWGAALAFAWVGFAWFQRTRKGFADVL